MIIKGTEVKTIEEAFSLLTPEQREHSKRIAAYSEAAFVRACSKDLYSDEQYGRTELVIENRSVARESGLYHDIGKICEGVKIPEDFRQQLEERRESLGAAEIPEPGHSLWGTYLIRTLYPRFRSSKTYHQRMLLSGAGDHHERYNGSGIPWGVEGKAIGYMGRIVAIAEELDHRARHIRSEDPIGVALIGLKEDAEKGLFDGELVKCFSAAAPSLRKTFRSFTGETKAIKKGEAWIKRRPNRALALRYRTCTSLPENGKAWLCTPYYRKGTEYAPLTELSEKTEKRKLGPQLGTYFLYELCDAFLRFDRFGIPAEKAFITLPEDFFTQKKLAKEITNILEDEQFPAERLVIILPRLEPKKGLKQYQANIVECEFAGIQLLPPGELPGALSFPEDAPLLAEEDIAGDALGVPGTPKKTTKRKPKAAENSAAAEEGAEAKSGGEGAEAGTTEGSEGGEAV